MKHQVCQTCGVEFEYEPIILYGRERFPVRHCLPCRLAETARLRREREAERRRHLEAAWEAICPPAYRDTDPAHPELNRRLLDGLLRYRPCGRGIGLYGPTGRGKTRMMYLLLKKLHFDGYRVHACSAPLLSQSIARQWGEDREADHARYILRQCYAAEILFLDDVGKQRFTSAAESEFYTLIETRTSQLRPILWTANATGSALAAMMSPDRGEPIVRRLEEFCEVLGV